MLAGGRIYVTREGGTTTVLAAKGEFEVLAENSLDEYTLSSIAISDGQRFSRTSKHRFCIDPTSD